MDLNHKTRGFLQSVVKRGILGQTAERPRLDEQCSIFLSNYFHYFVIIISLFPAIAKKEAAAAAVTAKKEAAAEAARQKKEAAAAKFWETGESIKSTTTSTTEYVKSSSSNAASSVNSGFWNVVTMAQKVKRIVFVFNGWVPPIILFIDIR